jgi:integrase
VKQDEDKNTYPPNVYMIGDNWTVDFRFRGERYRERLGPMSRGQAKKTAESRKVAVAEGRLAVNGRRLVNNEWIIDEAPKKIADPIFKEAVEKFLTWYATERPKSATLAGYNAKPLTTFFSDYRLSQISPFLIDKYKLERRKVCDCLQRPKNDNAVRCAHCGQRLLPLANATLNRELALLSRFSHYATERKLVAEPLTISLLKEDNARTRYLSEDEAIRLLDACNEDFRVVVLVAMHTGFRSQELKTLRWLSVNLAHRSVTVQSCYSKNSETRTVPMTDEVYEALKALKAERDRKPEDVVFVNRYGKPWKSWRTAFQNACDRAGLKDFHFHDLRHSYGSWLGQNNVNLKAMQELLGHKDVTMTMRYTHINLDYKRDAVAMLPSFSKSPRKSPRAKNAKVVGFGK